jgi:hypothetical protein
MKNLILSFTLACMPIFYLTGCISPGGWGGQTVNPNGQISPQDVIAFVHDAINTLNNKVSNMDKTQQMIETITGPIDLNGDGVISPDEARTAGIKLAASKDPKAVDLLSDPMTYVLLGGSFIGMHGAKSGGMAAVKGVLSKLADHINEQNGTGNADGKAAS